MTQCAWKGCNADAIPAMIDIGDRDVQLCVDHGQTVLFGDPPPPEKDETT